MRASGRSSRIRSAAEARVLAVVLVAAALLPFVGPAVTLTIRRRWLAAWLVALMLLVPLLGWAGTALMTAERCRGGGCMGAGLVLYGALGLALLPNLAAAAYRWFAVRGYR